MEDEQVSLAELEVESLALVLSVTPLKPRRAPAGRVCQAWIFTLPSLVDEGRDGSTKKASRRHHSHRIIVNKITAFLPSHGVWG